MDIGDWKLEIVPQLISFLLVPKLPPIILVPKLPFGKVDTISVSGFLASPTEFGSQH
jgi:hypothetical protein